MVRFAADENFNADIVRGLRRRKPDIDIVQIQKVGLSGKEDPFILNWAAAQNRLILTHDVSTMTTYANERVKAGFPCLVCLKFLAACQSPWQSKTFC